MNTLQFILDNVFNRLDYQTTHTGQVIRDYVYWKECNPVIIPGPGGPTNVGGGYLIVYSNNDALHTYDHPENIFKKLI